MRTVFPRMMSSSGHGGFGAGADFFAAQKIRKGAPVINIGRKRTVVGLGNALRLNPALRNALEKRLKVRCIVPEVEEMAAWGGALHVIDRVCRKTQESVAGKTKPFRC